MPGRKVDIEEIKKKRQELIDSNPELAKASEEWNKEYEFRKKLSLAREETGMTQKQLQEASGLDQRTISRIEVDKNISPSIKTVIRYVHSLGYDLELVKKT